MTIVICEMDGQILEEYSVVLSAYSPKEHVASKEFTSLKKTLKGSNRDRWNGGRG